MFYAPQFLASDHLNLHIYIFHSLNNVSKVYTRNEVKKTIRNMTFFMIFDRGMVPFRITSLEVYKHFYFITKTASLTFQYDWQMF